jgi:hypothetical protein
MAFQTPIVPDLNTTIPQQPDLLQKLAQFTQLRSMLGTQQLIPLQIQAEQQRVQSEKTQNEMQQIALKTQQARAAYWTNPGQFEDESPSTGPAANTVFAVSQMLGLPVEDPAIKMVAGLIKAGVPGDQAIADAKGTMEFRQTAAKGTLDQQKILSDSLGQLRTLAAPILAEKDPTKRNQLIENARPTLQEWAKFDPSLNNIVPQLNASNLDAFVNRIGAEKESLDLVQSRSEAASAGTTAQKGALEVAPPSTDQLNTFTTTTVPSFSSLHPEQKSAFIAEAKGARTVDELNKVIDRADATDKSEQMHADSLAQTKALSDVHFSQKGLEDNDKMWTDPQHGYVTVASQVNLVKQALKEGADGNGLAASMAPVMTALGINSFNQMHRISSAGRDGCRHARRIPGAL